jgi:hypothetical protein
MKLYGGYVLASAILVLFFGFAESAATVSLGVAPPLVEISVPAGGVDVIDLRVYNQGDSRLKVKASVSSIELSTDGAPVPLETAEGEWSCAKWITLDTEAFELAPGADQEVSATISVPRGVKGGRYAVVLFEAMPAFDSSKLREVALGTRVGSIVMETVPRTLHRDGKIEDMEVSKTDEEGVGFRIGFRNTGNVHVKVRGSIVIKDVEGKIVDRVPLEVGTGTILPDGVRTLVGRWSNPRKMEEGDYTGEARVVCPGVGQVSKVVSFSL